jgi:hypothetical protein
MDVNGISLSSLTLVNVLTLTPLTEGNVANSGVGESLHLLVGRHGKAVTPTQTLPGLAFHCN